MAKVSCLVHGVRGPCLSPLRPKDIVVLCLDVCPSMSLSPLDGGETALEKAIRVMRQITQQKVFGTVQFCHSSLPAVFADVCREQGFAGIGSLWN